MIGPLLVQDLRSMHAISHTKRTVGYFTLYKTLMPDGTMDLSLNLANRLHWIQCTLF